MLQSYESLCGDEPSTVGLWIHLTKTHVVNKSVVRTYVNKSVVKHMLTNQLLKHMLTKQLLKYVNKSVVRIVLTDRLGHILIATLK